MKIRKRKKVVYDQIRYDRTGNWFWNWFDTLDVDDIKVETVRPMYKKYLPGFNVKKQWFTHPRR